MDKLKRIACFALFVLLFIFLSPYGHATVKHISYKLRERERIEALRLEPGYIAKQGFYVTEEKYKVFYMVNESQVDDILNDIVTDQFIADLHKIAGGDLYGPYEIELYLMIPTKEAPYGWTDEKASSEFQDATLLHMAVYRIRVPGAASTIDACTVQKMIR